MTTDDTPDPILAAPLAQLRAAMAAQATPRGVEKELMDAFAKLHPRRRWYQALSPRQWRVAGGVGVGSSALLAALVLMQPLSPPAPQHAAIPVQPVAADVGPPFIALQPIERIEHETNPRMLEADVPRTALASLGLAVDPEQAGDSVRAEMLVGADGSPLALRLVSLP